MTVYANPDDCFAAIKKHAKQNPISLIMSCSDPQTLMMGWKCSLTGKKFLVKWSSFKKWLENRRREKLRPLEQFFSDWDAWRIKEDGNFESPNRDKIISHEDLERMKKLESFI